MLPSVTRTAKLVRTDAKIQFRASELRLPTISERHTPLSISTAVPDAESVTRSIADDARISGFNPEPAACVPQTQSNRNCAHLPGLLNGCSMAPVLQPKQVEHHSTAITLLKNLPVPDDTASRHTTVNDHVVPAAVNIWSAPTVSENGW